MTVSFEILDGQKREKMIRNVPVVEVNRDNFMTLWPSIIFSIRRSSFLALDVELSGLGDRRKLTSKSIDDRYSSVSNAAKSRSIVSLGLSCFAECDNDGSDSTAVVFNTQTFNFMVLCDEEFVIEPATVQFLIDHGFDFNLHYSKGLPYRRQGIRVNTDKEQFTLCDLISEILSSRKPTVFHNGLIDLIFLYANFLTDLPSNLQTFVADVAALFPSGVYDTKFIADYCARYQASYLEYVFRKCQRENERESRWGQPHVAINLPPFPANVQKWVEWASCGVPSGSNDRGNVCPVFASHGWCKDGRRCESCHDVDAVLDQEEAKLARKRAKKRRRKNETERENEESVDYDANGKEEMETESTSTPVTSRLPLYTGAHRAGYDAFMTGFSLAYFSMKLDGWRGGGKETFRVAAFKNKIALSGKEYPLLVQASTFAKPSTAVQEIMKGLV